MKRYHKAQRKTLPPCPFPMVEVIMFRSTLIIGNDTPLATISDILGRVDTDSTVVYLKVYIEKLKKSSL